jgi:hypothetical protein
MAVARQTHVALEAFRAALDRFDVGREGVLGRHRRRAAVCDDSRTGRRLDRERPFPGSHTLILAETVEREVKARPILSDVFQTT